ncbi:MAG TPA: hypothetical protein VKQ29_16195 [Aliidongia sp.]|nr:hypothetical protein [Aliidongia sp.]
MRVIIPFMAAGLGLIGLTGCIASDPYRTGAYGSGPTTTTTTTVVRDGYGNPLSTGETVRDANGNPVSTTSTGAYQTAPGYPLQPYRRY